MLIVILLCSLIGASNVHAASDDEAPSEILIRNSKPHYGAVPISDDKHREELMQKIAYTCNPIPYDSCSIDYSKDYCFAPNLKKCCYARTHQRIKYLDALDELFYPGGPWEKPGNCGKKCCLGTLRSGCNLCTCAGYLIPCAVSADLLFTCLTLTTIFSQGPQCTSFGEPTCNNACSDSTVYNAAGELLLPTGATGILLSSLCGILLLCSKDCVKNLSNPEKWSLAP